jgi:hypothetical protein
MGLRTSLVMLVLLAALGLALWFSEGEGAGDEPVLTDPVLDGRSLLEASAIGVRPDPDGLWIEFARGVDGVWRVVEPLRDLASTAVLDSLRSAYDTAQLVPAYEAAEVDARLLAETGLDRPRASFRAAWPDGREVELVLGLPSPLGDDLFARRIDAQASGRIHRVHRALQNALQVTPDDARERFVFVTEAAQARKVRLLRRGLHEDGRDDLVELVRSGAGFAMTEPAALRIDQGQAGAFVQQLLALRIDRFLAGRPDEGLSPLGPEKPADVSLLLEGGPSRETVDLYFVGDRSALVGVHRERGIWFSCDTRGYDRVVEVPAQALRAHWLFSVAIDAMNLIRLTPAGGPVFELERRPAGAFRIARPITARADPTAVAELLQGLRSVSVIEFVDDAPADLAVYGLGEGALALAVEERPGRGDRLLFGADTAAASTYARRGDEPAVVTVPRAAVERLRRPWWQYVDRQVLRIEDGGRVRRLLRTLADGTEVVFARGEDGRWRRGAAAEALPLVADTFDLLRDLRAEEVVPAGAPGDGVDAGTLELVGVGEQVLGRLTLRATAEQRVECAIADVPLVRFRLSARDSRDLLELR